MTQITSAELKLAYEISNCPLVELAFKDKSHPCNTVVNWQADQWSSELKTTISSKLHRPEAWTGLLSQAPIMFIASNPSFDQKEHFPNWDNNEWDETKIAAFGADRFVKDKTRPYGAIDSDNPKNRDRTIDKSGGLSKEVSHWKWVRKIAAFTLNKDISEVSAITDYVITEVVHCKSPKEQGVWEKSIKTCSDRYLNKILGLSPAKLIFFTGVKAGKAFAEANPALVPDDWGSWENSSKGKGTWPRTANDFSKLMADGQWTLETQMRNSFSATFAGKERTFIYIARPGGGAGLNAPWNHENLLHPELINFWRSKL